jgi:hypothetical protein
MTTQLDIMRTHCIVNSVTEVLVIGIGTVGRR